MKFVLLVSVLSLSLCAQAQSSGRVLSEALAVTQELQAAAPYLSANDEREIMQHLRAIRSIARGNGGSVGQGPSNGGVDKIGGGPSPSFPGSRNENYTCVSRDSDDRAPYVIGVRDGVTVTRIRTAVFGTQSECSEALNKARRIRGKSYLCVSRDSDGRAPYLMASLNGPTLARYANTSVDTYNMCMSTVQNLRPRNGSVIFCASRDNDGRAPYVALAINLDSGNVTKGTESFDTMQKCNQFVGE